MWGVLVWCGGGKVGYRARRLVTFILPLRHLLTATHPCALAPITAIGPTLLSSPASRQSSSQLKTLRYAMEALDRVCFPTSAEPGACVMGEVGGGGGGGSNGGAVGEFVARRERIRVVCSHEIHLEQQTALRRDMCQIVSFTQGLALDPASISFECIPYREVASEVAVGAPRHVGFGTGSAMSMSHAPR